MNPLSLTPLSEADGWLCRYYDTLTVMHPGCLRDAERVLALLSLPQKIARSNVSRQEGAQCGFWTIHWVEEECRRSTGELPWSLGYSLSERLKKIIAVRKVMLSA